MLSFLQDGFEQHCGAATPPFLVAVWSPTRMWGLCVPTEHLWGA